MYVRALMLAREELITVTPEDTLKAALDKLDDHTCCKR